jgi:hypothetical protein|tara:strand:+ start:24549 stop:25040 length:492 start_codon:yes stop_codon:yes gene_type:complete
MVLRQEGEQYSATRDELGTWRVLNLWNNELQQVGPEDDIPDDHPAVTVITEGAFIALVREAAQTGFLDNADLSGGIIPVDDGSMQEDLEKVSRELESIKVEFNDLHLNNLDKDRTIFDLREKNEDLKKKAEKPERSESFELQREAMDNIVRLVGVHEIGANNG